MKKTKFFNVIFLMICSATGFAMDSSEARIKISLIEASMNGTLCIQGDEGVFKDIASETVFSLKKPEIRKLNADVHRACFKMLCAVDFEKKMKLVTQQQTIPHTMEYLYAQFSESVILNMQLIRFQYFIARYFDTEELGFLLSKLHDFRENNSSDFVTLFSEKTDEALLEALHYWEFIIHQKIDCNGDDFAQKINSCLAELQSFPLKSLQEELYGEYKKNEDEQNATKVRNPYTVMATGW